MLANSLFDTIFFDNPVDYVPMWRRQQEINESVLKGEKNDTILFLQHNPVITLGLHADERNVRLTESQNLENLPDVVRIDRGGDVTFHGPGQLVVYFIINLCRRGLGVKKFVEFMEDSVIQLCGEYGIDTERRNDAPGVWCMNHALPKKICALGIRVRHGVTMHGLALNVTTDLNWFQFINPCGFSSDAVTSMKKEIGDDWCPDFQAVENRLKDILLENMPKKSV